MRKIVFIAVLLLTTVTAFAQYQYKGQTDKKGRPDGEGVMTWNDGSSFEGTFSKGEPVKGTFIKCNYSKKLSKIVGSFTTKKHPKGQLSSSDVLEHGYVELIRFGNDGLMYKGYKKNGVCEGQGECCYFWVDGKEKMRIAKGPWHDDLPDGDCLIIQSEGMRHCTVSNGRFNSNSRWKNHDGEAKSLWQKYYPHFIFGQLVNFEQSLDDLKNTGVTQVLTFKESLKFVEIGNVRWSGEVRDGKIQGEGMGFANVSGDYLIIRGKFRNGVLQGEGHFDYLKEKFLVETGESHNGFTSFHVDGKYGFINELGYSSIPATYKSVVEPFNTEGYAIVMNNKNEEIKIDKYGVEKGYSDHQWAIFEEARKERDRAAAILAEESRKAARKDLETRKYNSAKGYYESFNHNAFTTAYNEYMNEYPNDNSDHRSELEKMKSNIQTRESQIATGKDFSKWRMGNQVCVSHNGGILVGIVEKFNEDRSAAQVKIVLGPSGEYNGQTLKKNGTIWIQRGSGWHLALDEEIAYAQSNSSVKDPSLEPKVIYRESSSSSSSSSSEKRCPKCGGRGTQICWMCNGTGVWSGMFTGEETCSECKGSGHYRCTYCSGKGYVK